jgi:hypothetical protein
MEQTRSARGRPPKSTPARLLAIAGATQAQVAEQLGVTPGTVSRLLSGQVRAINYPLLGPVLLNLVGRGWSRRIMRNLLA